MESMVPQELDGPVLDDSLQCAKTYGESAIISEQSVNGGISTENQAIDSGIQVTCFTEDLHDVTLHFQIIRLMKQIYIWIGCNSLKFGHLYAAAPTRPNNMVSVTTLLGGGANNTGLSMAHRLVLKTGLNIILACNIPKDCPMIEADAERKLVEKLRSLGYIGPKSEVPQTSLSK